MSVLMLLVLLDGTVLGFSDHKTASVKHTESYDCHGKYL